MNVPERILQIRQYNADHNIVDELVTTKKALEIVKGHKILTSDIQCTDPPVQEFLIKSWLAPNEIDVVITIQSLETNYTLVNYIKDGYLTDQPSLA